jgi:hypothetical protein
MILFFTGGSNKGPRLNAFSRCIKLIVEKSLRGSSQIFHASRPPKVSLSYIVVFGAILIQVPWECFVKIDGKFTLFLVVKYLIYDFLYCNKINYFKRICGKINCNLIRYFIEVLPSKSPEGCNGFATI